MSKDNIGPRERAFREELAALMDKHKVEIEIEGDTGEECFGFVVGDAKDGEAEYFKIDTKWLWSSDVTPMSK